MNGYSASACLLQGFARAGMGQFENANVRFVAQSQESKPWQWRTFFVSVEMGRATWGQWFGQSAKGRNCFLQ